ncbi:peptide chain release factor 1 [Planoprotostelium fungivorum]|uniref:Peptide chain release factor 1 n=1 Tax=Planoprotostelium fungivorum TaxID=1890364 RepID=A0A2P6NK79_9EUKA|nr:peptide chain release factor 1 [Planoprotostelium fungivorum]
MSTDKPKITAPGKMPKIVHLEDSQILPGTLTEKFVKGSGNGGQKVNKTANCVYLVHNPTGVSVKVALYISIMQKISCVHQVQATRDREQNRKIARKLIEAKLDVAVNGTQSKAEKAAEKIRRRKSRAKRRADKKYSTEEEEIQEKQEKREEEEKTKTEEKEDNIKTNV